jgi:hypothetical protein
MLRLLQSVQRPTITTAWETLTVSPAPRVSSAQPDWVQSVMAKAVLPLALIAMWKLRYAIKDNNTRENGG